MITAEYSNNYLEEDVSSSACFVYVIGTLWSGTPENMSTYVGWSNDLEKRIAKHNEGTGAKSTRGRKWHLLYVEIYFSRSDAMSREWHLKRDRQFRKALLKNWIP